MLGQDEIITSELQGLIQGRVGTFLQLRSQLNEMSRSPILTISDSATQLLATQTQLETDVPDAVTKAQSGDISDIVSAGATYALMEKQIYDVGNLYDQYTGLGESAKASLIAGIPNWMLMSLVIGGGLILWKKIKGRKKQ